MSIEEIFAANGGVATAAQLQSVMSRKVLAALVRSGAVVRVCRGVYAPFPADPLARLAALDLLNGKPIVACMSTAAALYGFDTEHDQRIHILDPGVRVRPDAGLMVHQRIGAPLRRVTGRLATTPAWTAVEIARTLPRPRALAVLDAALHAEACTVDELDAAVREQKGRRGIAKVRELLAHADGRAESPMESEMRLVFIDWAVPTPELQYEIADRTGRAWRVDFAWPDAKVAAEYDSVEWHANPEAFKHDRLKAARLQECGWTSIPAVVDDIRRYPQDLALRIMRHLDRPALAG
ncbi:type IV toxin-antitoxin system AbiEi family antitoxin domain-containing protein [Mycolicibacterium sp.]|uniref:type IV toxin-antitoxin system AbiEi family antitoxin domain-containing protein n=1 Tax=Mycolicibacterium sp. TaxID=2320850 RepID=UPI0037C76D79